VPLEPKLLLVFRAIVTLTALIIAAAAFAACGSGDNSSTPTVTPPPTPASSAAGTAVPASTRSQTLAPTPSPANWTFSGAVVGSALVGASECYVSGGKFDIQLTGKLNNAGLGISISFAPSGTIDFSQRSEATVAVQYGAVTSSASETWFGTSGDAGMSGTATIDAKGGGIADLTVPPSAVSPGGATQPIHASGPWACP
jgi:hypothetical protein